MNHLNPYKTGVALGTLVGGLHFLWSVFVVLGWAQSIVNFSMWAHMVSVPVVVEPFDLSASVTVIVVAAIVGYIVGSIFARIWNHAHND